MRLVFGCNETQLSCFYQQYSVRNPSPFSQCKNTCMQPLLQDSTDGLGIESGFKNLREDSHKNYVGGLMLTFSHLGIEACFLTLKTFFFVALVW